MNDFRDNFMQQYLNIAVLMACYNRVETTLRCLRLLFAQKCNAHLSVFLVDDASPDGTGERVHVEFPQVNVIEGSGTLYWTRGMYLAWETAGDGYDAYLWLNDDVVLFDGALSGILKDAEDIGWCGTVIGAFVGCDGHMTYGVKENGKWIKPNGKPCLTNGDMSGNFVLVPRSVYERVGIIANCYSHAYGDHDYSARMRKKGVPYYLVSKICGCCDDSNLDYALESKSLKERIKFLFKPNGRSWRDAIIYRWRNYGFVRAFITAIHVPCLVLRGKRCKGLIP